MASSDTGQTRLSSSHPAGDTPDREAGLSPDSNTGNENEEYKQSEVPAVETSQAASNPWAPVNWSPDLPPRVVATAASQQQTAAQPVTRDMMAQTLAAITSLKNCVATLAATVNTQPPPVPPPQPRHTGVQRTPTLADFLMTPATTKKRYEPNHIP